MAPTLEDELRALGSEAGLDALGFAAAEPFLGTRADLEQRKAAGLHGGMAFTYRNPTRSTDPTRIVPGARALVVGAKSYRRADRDPAVAPAGVVARYSWRDHYQPLRDALERVAVRLRADGWRADVLADDNALVDREAAYRAGLGWYGKSSNLLLTGRGSWFVLGSIVTDAPLTPAAAPAEDGCGACSRCMTSCPTGAIVAPGVVDARRCLAWLLQATGPFPVEHRTALGGRVYGCDDCQEVCPPNRVAQRQDLPAATDEDEATVSLVEMLDSDDDTLIRRFGRWYIPQRDPRYLRRNALVALGNVGDGGDEDVERVLARALADGDSMIREHAAWAAERLGRGDLVS